MIYTYGHGSVVPWEARSGSPSDLPDIFPITYLAIERGLLVAVCWGREAYHVDSVGP